MIGSVVDFVQTARRAGLQVSPAESIDAVRAVELVGYADRGRLKDALAAVLAKSADALRLFDECFERYYAREQGALDPDELVELETIARGELAGVRFGTQANAAAYRVLERLGGRDLDPERRAALREQVRALVDRRLALAAPEHDRWRDELLARTRIGQVDRRDHARLRVLVRELARRLATRYGRTTRTARRGTLDVRRTFRRNAATDGIPFRTAWKRRAIEKPRVLALCDVSGSVAPVAQFLLLFLFSLRDALAGVHAFAFSNRLIEVTEILERHSVEEASALILRAVGFGSTDYGRALDDFAATWLDRVDRTTSILIMGDARSNYGDPRVEVLRALAARAKRVVWLNPEPRSSWATGDSEMLRYLPFCDAARVCASVRDLELVLADLLRRGA